MPSLTEPSSFTLKVPIMLVAFSVTIIHSPLGVNAICGASTFVLLKAFVDPEIWVRFQPLPTRYPSILSLPRFRTYSKLS